jgi:hypothetical protein
LFAGLEGWSKPFRERGHQVTSIDIDARFSVDVHADLLTWDYASLPSPDIILASPPCEAFSVMNIGRNWTSPTDTPPDAPKTEKAKLAMMLVERTLEIIAVARPSFFVIENPRAKLRKMPIMSRLERRTVTYCQLGHTTMKPTDLWGGFPPSLALPPPCKQGDSCHVAAPRGSKTVGSVQGTKGAAERGKIPYAPAMLVCEAAERDLATR